MGINLIFASSLILASKNTLRGSIRYVLVNERVPRADEHCALCGAMFRTGYARDFHTCSLFCNNRCFAGNAKIATSSTQTGTRKVS